MRGKERKKRGGILTPFHARREDIANIIGRVLPEDRTQTFGSFVAVRIQVVVFGVCRFLTMADEIDGWTV